MHPNSNRSARWREGICALCCLFLALHANGQAPTDPKQWRLLIEPTFMRPEVTGTIPGAQRTVLAAGYVQDGEAEYFSRKEFAGMGLDWDLFERRARENCAQELEGLKPEYTRDKRKVVVFATLKSARPFMAAAVLAPGLLKMFEDVFGGAVLVAIPDRHTAFVFPKLASEYEEYAPMVLDAYHDALHPVSIEVFEVSRKGVKAVGVYEEP